MVGSCKLLMTLIEKLRPYSRTDHLLQLLDEKGDEPRTFCALMTGPGKVPPAKVALGTCIRKTRQVAKGVKQPSGKSIGGDYLVRDLKLGVGGVDDTRRIRSVRPRTEPRARVRHERDCLQRTGDREKKDQRCQRERVHLERVKNRDGLEEITVLEDSGEE